MPEPELTMREAGKRGGAATKAKIGAAGYAAIGKRGGQTTRDRYGSEYYRRLGEIGGAKLLATYGPEYYRRIGKKGQDRVRELIAKGREKEEQR